MSSSLTTHHQALTHNPNRLFVMPGFHCCVLTLVTYYSIKTDVIGPKIFFMQRKLFPLADFKGGSMQEELRASAMVRGRIMHARTHARTRTSLVSQTPGN